MNAEAPLRPKKESILFSAIPNQNLFKDYEQNRGEVAKIAKASKQGIQRQVAKAVLASSPAKLLHSNANADQAEFVSAAVLKLKNLQGNDLEALLIKLNQNKETPVFSGFGWGEFDAIKERYERLENPKKLPPVFEDILKSVVNQRKALYGQFVQIQISFAQWVEKLSSSRMSVLDKLNGLLGRCKNLLGEIAVRQKQSALEKEAVEGYFAREFLAVLKNFRQILAQQSGPLKRPSASSQLIDLTRNQLDIVDKKVLQVELSLDGFRSAVALLQCAAQQLTMKDLEETSTILGVDLPSWWQKIVAFYTDPMSKETAERGGMIEEAGRQIEAWRKKLVQTMRRRWSRCEQLLDKRAHEAHITIKGGIPHFPGCASGEELLCARQLDLFKKNTKRFLKHLDEKPRSSTKNKR
jgi:hypothetical protein